MRAVHHIELCLEEIRHEIMSDDGVLLSRDERAQLERLVSGAGALMRDIAARHDAASVTNADLHWVKLAVEAVNAGLKAPATQAVGSRTEAASAPVRLVCLNGAKAAADTVAPSPAAAVAASRPARPRARPVLRVISRVAAGIACAAVVAGLMANPSWVQERVSGLKSQSLFSNLIAAR